MLKANVGVSRKMSKDYNSQGYTLNLEGEIQATLDDPDAVIERIKELYDLAEEALSQQVDRHQSDSAIASREADDQAGPPRARSNGHPAPAPNGHRDAKPANNELATNKQVAFLLTLAKRQKLQGPRLEARIEEVVGRHCSPYDLSKKEAGAVIDALNPEAVQDNRSRR